MSQGAHTAAWSDALLAADVCAVAPERLGGVRVMAPAGPPREAFVQRIATSLHGHLPLRRLPLSASDEALLGGPDLAATLAAGRLVTCEGLLSPDRPLLLVVPMAERIEQRIAGILARALDQPRPTPLVCLVLDDGREANEQPPTALCDRLALGVDLRGVGDVPEDCASLSDAQRDAARRLLPRVAIADAAIASLCGASLALGIASLRAPVFAVDVARICAALSGREIVSDDDIAFAARLVLAPRATVLPQVSEDEVQDGQEPEAATQPETPSEASSDQSDTPRPGDPQAPDDFVIAAVRTALPAGLLGGSGPVQRAAAKRNGKSGTVHAARRRGRPIASRPGRLSEGRLDLLATLKAAAPWQTLRTRVDARESRLEVRRGDIHIRRQRERSESLTIFVVDASGSTASQRLAEAKGAVELLLADCYVRRDQVALITFRKKSAEVVLPPTRSLARAKRLLAEMPAGGGTPLGAAITAATELAEAARRGGLAPLMVFLTDGGANVASDGGADRPRAEDEARRAARRAAALGHNALLIDVSFRDRPFAREISMALRARHVNLPRADAAGVARAVEASIRHA